MVGLTITLKIPENSANCKFQQFWIHYFENHCTSCAILYIIIPGLAASVAWFELGRSEEIICYFSSTPNLFLPFVVIIMGAKKRNRNGNLSSNFTICFNHPKFMTDYTLGHYPWIVNKHCCLPLHSTEKPWDHQCF